MATRTPQADEIPRTWHEIDADGKVLGRLAVEAATLLRGKHKPYYTPNVDCGDHVVIVNADKIVVTSNKADQKKVYRHSGYPGGLTATRLADELATRPEEVVRRAVKGMLPKNRLSRKLIKKLKVYSGPEHPHEAQFKGTPGAPNSRKAAAAAKPAKAAKAPKAEAAPAAAADADTSADTTETTEE